MYTSLLTKSFLNHHHFLWSAWLCTSKNKKIKNLFDKTIKFDQWYPNDMGKMEDDYVRELWLYNCESTVGFSNVVQTSSLWLQCSRCVCLLLGSIASLHLYVWGKSCSSSSSSSTMVKVVHRSPSANRCTSINKEFLKKEKMYEKKRLCGYKCVHT